MTGLTNRAFLFMRSLLLLLMLISLTSCGRKILFQEAEYMESSPTNTPNRIDVNTYYAGDAFSFITFIVEVDNRSADTIILTESNVLLEYQNAVGAETKLYPIRKKKLITDYKEEQKSLEYNKKATTVNNIVSAGLGVLIGITGGADAVGIFFYGVDATSDILADREYYENAQGSVEDQLAYMEEYTLESDTILPGRLGSFDVHFDRLMMSGLADLKVACDSITYSTTYNLEVKEANLR